MNVVSFFAPRPEHPFYQDYTPFLAILRESCERLGHRHMVLTDDQTVAADAYVTELPSSLMKAVLAAQLAYLSDPAFADTPTLLVGADCVLANDPVAFAQPDADLVITVGNFTDCRMNTGAIYVPRPALVVSAWQEALAHVGDDWGDDQTALYRAILNWATTKGHLAEVLVDPFNLAPEHPGDDCRRGVVLHFRGPRKAWMVNYCHHWFGIGVPYVAVALPNTDADRVRDQMMATLARGLPEVRPAAAHNGHAVLVGGGPSLAANIEEIRYRAGLGQTIFALNGAAHFLASHGIIADYQVMLDAREENVRFVVPADAKDYLLASQCHAAVFDAVPSDLIHVWHCAVEDGDVLPAVDPPHHYVMCDVTVGLTAMSLVFMMGYRKLHLYGYDSSDADGAMHAYDQTQARAESTRVEVWCDGRKFSAGIAMYAQAQGFQEACQRLWNADENTLITVHGDGLLPALARSMVRPTLTEEIAA